MLGRARALPGPTRAWEVLQLGNCGSPIETDAGWLVLTHGVGPMRTYSIGALLLDLDDPTRVIGQLRQPLLSPAADEQDGYVPNVVYSCGALVHAGTLVLPYGIGDAAIGFATVPMSDSSRRSDARRSDEPCGSPCSLRSPGGCHRATTGRGSSSPRC